MSVQGWITIGISTVSLLIVIIGLFSRNASRISVLETEMKALNEELKLHSSLNERTFTRLETQLTEISKTLSILQGFIEAKLK